MGRREHRKAPITWILLVLLAILIIIFKDEPWLSGKQDNKPPNTKENFQPGDGDAGLNRSLSRLIYSKHARCRMDCRQIDEIEVKEILSRGKVNFTKSDLKNDPDPIYALEGITRDKQRVRIVFAQGKESLTVVTCIDLDREWACECGN